MDFPRPAAAGERPWRLANSLLELVAIIRSKAAIEPQLNPSRIILERLSYRATRENFPHFHGETRAIVDSHEARLL